MKNRKQKVYLSLIMVCLVLNSILITEIFAATTVLIDLPSSGQNYNDLLNHEYIVFKFRILGGYQSYSTFIDAQYDPDLKHVGLYIYYDVNLFISKYGRGVHTFTVSVKASGLVPEGMIEGGRSTIIKSVEFTVIPVLCHFVGFGFDLYDEYSNMPLKWRSNIEPFRDMLLSDRAKYIPGYFATHYDWNDGHVSGILDTLVIKEIEKDVVVVLFSAHGHAVLAPGWGDAWIHSHSTTWFPEYGWTPLFMGIADIELKGWHTNLETNNLIYIVDSCHSEGFLDEGEDLDNKKHLMVACEWDESAWQQDMGYNPSSPLDVRIDAMHSPFLRKMCQSYYFNYYDTEQAFDAAYNWITINYPGWDQHPMDSCDLQTTLYLCQP